MGKLFGTDGMRGVAGEYPLTSEIILKVGRATTSFFSKEHTPKIIIGRDTRVSGTRIEKTLVEGVISAGGQALLAGVVPTPAVALITKNLKADAGIVISASHNPYQDNGIKIFSEDGSKLPDKVQEEIEDLILSKAPKAQGRGSSRKLDNSNRMYLDFLKGTLPDGFNLRGMKVGIDCANGATYRVAPELFSELGAELNSLFVSPNGKNINDNCGSQHPEKLVKEVVANGLDIGLAFDGDGDRLIAVDEKGAVLTGGQVMAICAKVMKDEGRLTNNLVVSTVMSNIGFDIALKELGIVPLRTQVGDRYVMQEMRERGAVIGGEQSGHIIFLDHHTTGDGMLTALQLIYAMKKEGKPLSELAKVMTVYPQALINLTVKKKPDISTVPEIVTSIAEAEKKLGEGGRVLVRYSGTQPMCRVMVEGPTQKETEECCKKIAKVVGEKLG